VNILEIGPEIDCNNGGVCRIKIPKTHQRVCRIHASLVGIDILGIGPNINSQIWKSSVRSIPQTHQRVRSSSIDSANSVDRRRSRIHKQHLVRNSNIDSANSVDCRNSRIRTQTLFRVAKLGTTTRPTLMS
jgi:hypothetical protein